MTEQPKWLERAKETYKFHRSKLVSHDKWNLTATAKLLRRSIGSISEDLMIVRFCRHSEKKIERFEHRIQALEFIRSSNKALEMQDD
jgi:hypothetical protein